jgi:hypothetical protein
VPVQRQLSVVHDFLTPPLNNSASGARHGASPCRYKSKSNLVMRYLSLSAS